MFIQYNAGGVVE